MPSATNATTLINIPKIAAVVVLYNSIDTIMENIETYKNQVDVVYIIDNSDVVSPKVKQYFDFVEKVVYFSNGGNKGVGVALNLAANTAINEGYDYLLTMDDDSKTPPQMIEQMVNYLKKSVISDKIAILSPIHTFDSTHNTARSVSITMTSGNLLNLSIYKEVGPYREDFFIDHIDHEYCLRLRQAGYKIIELTKIQLDHRLGEIKNGVWGLYHFTSHSPLRGYYMARNGWTVARLYPVFQCEATKLIAKEWLKALLFDDHKIERMFLIWRGVQDAWRGRLGKYNR